MAFTVRTNASAARSPTVTLHLVSASTTICHSEMTVTHLVSCDGCGQAASPEHIAQRLARLEWTTRYRPVHIATVLLGAVAPAKDAEFLYAPDGGFAGTAGIILDAVGLSPRGRPAETVLAEFQRSGLFLAYVLECPLEETSGSDTGVEALLAKQWPAILARIRRSLKPKRLIPISSLLEELVPKIGDLGCVIALDGNKPFALDGPEASWARLRQVLRSPSAAGQ
jgi:hypothetical protein